MSKNIITNILFFLLIIANPDNAAGQHLNQSLEFFTHQKANYQINKTRGIIHSGFKPLLKSTLAEIEISDSIENLTNKDKLFSEKFKSKWIYRKVRVEDFVNYDSKNFHLKINPLFDFTFKKSPEHSETFYRNTRGIEFKGDIGNKISFYSAFYENEARFEPFIASYINDQRVAPGQGAVKILSNNKFDFSRASAYLTIKPNESLMIQLGHYKHFIGEGYRSLLLSDNSFNYPYLKIVASFGKFQYTLLWNQYELFTGAYYSYHNRKYASVLYLSWVPKADFELGLFESIMWPGNTPEERNNFNLNFFNPLILSRVPIYGLNSKENILLGINARLKIYQFAQVFAQVAIDDIDSHVAAKNNFAFQVGIKHFDLFHQKLANQSLFLHTEYNYIAPYTYTWQNTKQSYTHYNQPLAHPLGAGLHELLAAAKYFFKDFSIEFRGNYLINSADTVMTNFGCNLFLPNKVIDGVDSYSGNSVGQGVKNKLLHVHSEFSFTINPATNMRFFAALHFRKNMNSILNEQKIFYSFGIKTNINNYYYDF